MPIEIERKFLVKNDTWRPSVVQEERLRDGLIASTGGLKIRVRLSGNRATIAVKSKQENGVRSEYEYEISLSDAKEMLDGHCDGRVLDKTRHHVPFAGLLWAIDVYEGPLAGIILAEVELEHVGQDVAMPDWIGEEVTGRPEYRKINMLLARLASFPAGEDQDNGLALIP